MKDLKYAFFPVGNNSGLITAALLTIALCFGANLLISSVARSMLLRDFPFLTPDQLTTMFIDCPNSNGGAMTASPTSCRNAQADGSTVTWAK